MAKYYDITGQTFGYYTVLERDYSNKDIRNSRWICRCKCGNVKSVSRPYLTKKHIVSCGCRQYESKNFTHKLSKERIYREWAAIKGRCYNAHGKDIKDYQSKGIIMCDSWKNDFMTFYIWAMNNGYNDSLTIDRIDVNGNYEPSNCRWISIQAQQRNKSNTVKIIFDGKEESLRTVCEKINFPFKTAHNRYYKWKKKGREFTTDDLFAPIQYNKISYRFRPKLP